MFFLRCAFWLSVVYSSMSWTNMTLQPHGQGTPVAAMGASLTAHLTETALAGASDLCTRHAAECLSDAARLTSLFAATDPSNDPELGPADAESARDVVPLRVPAPRRHVGSGKLAHAS